MLSARAAPPSGGLTVGLFRRRPSPPACLAAVPYAALMLRPCRLAPRSSCLVMGGDLVVPLTLAQQVGIPVGI